MLDPMIIWAPPNSTAEITQLIVGQLTTVVVATIGAYGIWQEWWIGETPATVGAGIARERPLRAVTGVRSPSP
jgi:hypothetical protein